MEFSYPLGGSVIQYSAYGKLLASTEAEHTVYSMKK